MVGQLQEWENCRSGTITGVEQLSVYFFVSLTFLKRLYIVWVLIELPGRIQERHGKQVTLSLAGGDVLLV